MRATGVRSRYVTATCGGLLVVLALVAPLARLANAIPGAGGGRHRDHRVRHHLRHRDRDAAPGGPARARATCSPWRWRSSFGLLPILVPGLYGRFPPTLQIILGNGLAMGTVAAVIFKPSFTTGRRAPASRTAGVAAP